jgi:hypothetical protein
MHLNVIITTSDEHFKDPIFLPSRLCTLGGGNSYQSQTVELPQSDYEPNFHNFVIHNFFFPEVN